MITITCNGKPHEVPEGNTILDLLKKFELTEQRIAIEMNRKIIPKSIYHQTTLQPGDKVEIVHAIGGG